MEIIMLIVFLLGLPRTLWCIPVFLVLWYASGGSSGGTRGDGSNAGYTIMYISILGICAWGVLQNIKKHIFKLK